MQIQKLEKPNWKTKLEMKMGTSVILRTGPFADFVLEHTGIEIYAEK